MKDLKEIERNITNTILNQTKYKKDMIKNKEIGHKQIILIFLIIAGGLFCGYLISVNNKTYIFTVIVIILLLIIFLRIMIFKDMPKNMADLSEDIWSILKIIIFCLIIIYAGYVANWAFETESGIMIQPFEISNLGENISGTSIADLLSSELKDIADTNNRMQNETQLNDYNYYVLEVPSLHSKSIESSLSNIGSVGYGGSSLSLGQLSLSLKRLLKTQPLTIKGSVSRYGSIACVVADTEETYPKIWKLNRNLTDLNELPEEAIPQMTKDLAYQIALDLSRLQNGSEGELPQTWQAFEYVNEAQKEYLEYIDTGNYTHLYSAEENALSALNSEPNYKNILGLYNRIGREFLDGKKYNDSERIFKKILENYRSFNTAMDLGTLYSRQKKYQNATEAFDYAIRLKPDNCYAWYYKGKSLQDNGFSEKADLAYDCALFYNPIYAPAWNKKGEIILEKENLSEDDYSEAVRLFHNATNNDEKLGVAWYNHGRALYRLKEYNNARFSFTKAAELNYSKAWNYIGLIENESNNYPQAINAYDYYLGHNSGDEIENAMVWFNKGMACYSWKRFTIAIESFEQSISRFNKTNCTEQDCVKTYMNASKYKEKAYYEYNQSIQANNTAIELEKLS